MLVYGDHRELADPSERLLSISEKLREIAGMPSGLERHANLVGALIAAGQLTQGVADEAWPTAELDQFLGLLARSVILSWDSGFEKIGALPQAPAAEFPARVELRVPEGFAFYCVYPEHYLEAARKLRLTGSPRVIGIRSIGTTLGAIVAAALGAPPPITVRPTGDPFARNVELAEEVVERDAHYVIVDEGPGQSGSSFGAVADWLEARQVPLERIAFIPSHSGEPGPRASEAHLRRWARAQRVPACFDPAFLDKEFGPLEPFAGGGPWQRRKYLGRKAGERVLLKFAGLGEIGEGKLRMARALHAAGFTIEPLGLAHGFLVERWGEDLRALEDGNPAREIGRYIGARARLFPAPDGSGASIEDLLEMCRRNISLGLGSEAACAMARFTPQSLCRCVRRVRTDNKLDREEWLRMPNGRLLKTDALDHHQAHDLIGCQDLAWDVAGAIVEFALDGSETARLISETGDNVPDELLAFYIIAYACFRLGQAEISSSGLRETDRYRSVLHRHLQEAGPFATPQESLVG